ncbi:hypothetical protein DFH28DRAFT_1126358 [Melampsora americana]|nr:hypothetical protein DFH28DRAFT_1126358 [Melampsora americana]
MPPTLPPRPSHLQTSSIPIQPTEPIYESETTQTSLDSDEPPPAYTPTATDQTKTIQSGPSYPFGPTPSTFNSHYIHPQPNSNTLFNHHQPAHLPSFHPNSNPSYHQLHSTHHHPNQPLSSSSTSSQSHFPPPPPPPNQNLEPTTIPTHGRPLLYDDRVLVYPPSHLFFCSKCCNTGYKGFDPARPCRKVNVGKNMDNFGQRSKALSNPNQLNLQRPLPPIQGNPINPNSALIVRPGDARIGGRLCWNCNGKGES